MPSEIPVTILVEEGRFDDALRSVSGAGLTVDAELREIGVIGARVPADRLDAVTGLDGVRAVEQDPGVQLPPPDADVQ